jgi:hypothetical protein
MLQKTFDELWESISEVEIEKWISLINAERKCSGNTNSTEPELSLKVQQTTAKNAAERDQQLKDILYQLDQPIIQIADQISAFRDRFESGFYFTVLFWQPCSLPIRTRAFRGV